MSDVDDIITFEPIDEPELAGQYPAQIALAKLRVKEDGSKMLIVDFSLDEMPGTTLTRFFPLTLPNGSVHIKARPFVKQLAAALGLDLHQLKIDPREPLAEFIGFRVTLDIKMGEYLGDRRPEIKRVLPPV